jgi:hypothetical protein
MMVSPKYGVPKYCSVPEILKGIACTIAELSARMAAVLPVFLLIALMVLLVLAMGLPLLVGAESRLPDILGFAMLTGIVAVSIWATGAWWIMLPILVLLAWVVRFDRPEGAGPANLPAPERRGMSAPTRLRFRLWLAALTATPVLIASLFVLPAGSAGTVVIPGLVVAMVAATLFRLSFYRAARRDEAL